VVGDLQNVHPFGIQEVHNLPWPAESVKRVYWCEGEFIAHTVVRGGRLAPGKMFVWGSGFPGCVLRSFGKSAVGEVPTTQLWFVREEKERIRPVSDMVLRYVFHGTWDTRSNLAPQTRFALLLLSPRANGASPREFAPSVQAMAGTACSLLSRVECVKEVRHLGSLGDAELKAAACQFLAYQFREGCSE
jgi:hypothetical protein